MDRTLIVLCGLPRSGKSTYARSLGHPIVNPDSIRLALHGHRYVHEAERFVWAITDTMVRALFLAGHTHVVLDATNTTKKGRQNWLNQSWRTIFHLVGTRKEVCLERAAAQNDSEIVPVIERMATQWEEVSPDEGPVHVVA